MVFMFKKKCDLCKQIAKEPRKYYNDRNKAVIICVKCVVYAERRAFLKRTN